MPRRPMTWVLFLIWLLVALSALVLVVIGLVMAIKGGEREHILKGGGLDPHWEKANGVALLVMGSAFVALGMAGVAAVARLRRRLRQANRQPGPPLRHENWVTVARHLIHRLDTWLTRRDPSIRHVDLSDDRDRQ